MSFLSPNFNINNLLPSFPLKKMINIEYLIPIIILFFIYIIISIKLKKEIIGLVIKITIFIAIGLLSYKLFSIDSLISSLRRNVNSISIDIQSLEQDLSF